MDAASLSKFEGMLKEMKRATLAGLLKEHEAYTELGADMDGDIADIAFLSYEKQMIEGMSQKEKEKLARINAALGRIAKGKFGVCVDCGDDIAIARLEALPWAFRCVACLEKRERGTRRQLHA